MPSNVEPHEAEAIRDLLGGESEAAIGEVIERDFHQPRRLGSAEFVEFRRQLELELPGIEEQFRDLIDSDHPIELGGLGEINASGLFSASEGPQAAIVFEVQGQPAWITWENVAAINTLEKILGSQPESTEARPLTHVEVGVLERLLSILADGVLRSLKLEGSNMRVAQTRETLGTWRDAGDKADPHRLHIELPFSGPREASCFHIYIPAPGQGERVPGQSAAKINLPKHLEEVSVDVSLTLGSCEIMLNQLLELEEGDVIPLDTRLGELASLNVEGRPHARGILGRKHKQVAIRIEHLTREPS